MDIVELTALLSDTALGAEKGVSKMYGSPFRLILTIAAKFMERSLYWWCVEVFKFVQTGCKNRKFFLQKLCAAPSRTVRVFAIAFSVSPNARSTDWARTVTSLHDSR